MVYTALPTIRPGDVVVVDNATIHSGWAFEVVADVYRAAGARLVPTPYYSPELNVTELCIGKVRAYLKGCGHDQPLLNRLVDACSTVTGGDLIHYYCHCGYDNF